MRCPQAAHRSHEVADHDTRRRRAYNFIQRQVQEGRQAFIVYPLVEESRTTRQGGGRGSTLA